MKTKRCSYITYSTNHPQLKRPTHVTHYSESHTCRFLRYHVRVHAHTVFTHAYVFTRVHACMANVASYLPFNLNYNATILVTLFFSAVNQNRLTKQLTGYL